MGRLSYGPGTTYAETDKVAVWYWQNHEGQLRGCITLECPEGSRGFTFPIPADVDPKACLTVEVQQRAPQFGIPFNGLEEWKTVPKEDESIGYRRTIGVGDTVYLVGSITTSYDGRFFGRLFFTTHEGAEKDVDLYHVSNKDTLQGVKTALARKAGEIITTVHGMRGCGLTTERIELTAYDWQVVNQRESDPTVLFDMAVELKDGTKGTLTGTLQQTANGYTGTVRVYGESCGGLSYSRTGIDYEGTHEAVLQVVPKLCMAVGIDVPDVLKTS